MEQTLWIYSDSVTCSHSLVTRWKQHGFLHSSLLIFKIFQHFRWNFLSKTLHILKYCILSATLNINDWYFPWLITKFWLKLINKFRNDSTQCAIHYSWSLKPPCHLMNEFCIETVTLILRYMYWPCTLLPTATETVSSLVLSFQAFMV